MYILACKTVNSRMSGGKSAKLSGIPCLLIPLLLEVLVIHIGESSANEVDCGGAVEEALARERCDTRWAWLTPDSCYHWPVCFAGICPLAAAGKLNGSSTQVYFCGDGHCDLGSESTQSCPADCCPLVNDECKVTNNVCPRDCCNEGVCCRDPGLFCMKQVWLIVTACAVVVANVLLWCTFFCCCSSRNCKCFLTG